MGLLKVNPSFELLKNIRLQMKIIKLQNAQLLGRNAQFYNHAIANNMAERKEFVQKLQAKSSQIKIIIPLIKKAELKTLNKQRT
jgi:hypothetical protein